MCIQTGVESGFYGIGVSLAKTAVGAKVYIGIKTTGFKKNSRVEIGIIRISNHQPNPVWFSGGNICGSIHYLCKTSHVDGRSRRIIYLITGKKFGIIRFAGGIVGIIFYGPDGNRGFSFRYHGKVNGFAGRKICQQEGEYITGNTLPFPVFVGSK